MQSIDDTLRCTSIRYAHSRIWEDSRNIRIVIGDAHDVARDIVFNAIHFEIFNPLTGSIREALCTT